MNKNSVVDAIGGMDGNKMMVELIKLLKADCLGGGSSASTILSIRESSLTETERLLLAFLYGKHVGSTCVLELKGIEEARTYLMSMADLVVAPIEEVEKGYAEITED